MPNEIPQPPATEHQACENTDRELYSSPEGSVHVTKQGAIGINLGGFVHVKPLAEWHKLAGGKWDFFTGKPEFSAPSETAPSLLDEAAEIAGRDWNMFSQLKEAHERHSKEPFRTEAFGINYDKALYSRDCMERIQALKSAAPSATRTPAEVALYEVIDAVCGMGRPWELQGHGISAKRAEEICELAEKGKP